VATLTRPYSQRSLTTSNPPSNEEKLTKKVPIILSRRGAPREVLVEEHGHPIAGKTTTTTTAARSINTEIRR
jgi:hypothetical protein